MSSSLDIGIVGAGTAGSAAALFLARAGHRVTLYERVEHPGPVGAGIVLQPTGQAVLARLGLAPQVIAAGARLDRLRCARADGRPLFSLVYADLEARHFGLGLHRGTLFHALFEAVRATPEITVRLGVELVSSRQVDGGRTVTDAAGQTYGPHTLLVVADGAASRLRDEHPAPRRDAIYPWGALWSVSPDPERAFSGELFQIVDRAEVLLGFLPTGKPPGAAAPVVSIFWSLRRRDLEAFRAGDLAAWKRRIVAYEPRAAALVAPVIDECQVLFSGYRDLVLRRLHGPGVVYLGDAAHAMSPQLGQGANLALFDAMVLADSLAALSNLPHLRAVLELYSRTRRPHVAYYQLASRWLTPFFQGDSRVLATLRDLAFPWGVRFGYLRRRMIRCMAGLETGVVRAPLRLNAPPRDE
jgi:2-polyprenyl-6-methoxyphenol hydroxylase-like FAD-dependent oxidoreductase